METRAAQRLLLVALLASIMATAARAADEIRAGKWQFTTQMQMPDMPQSAPGAQPPTAGNQPMTRTACINAANPVPAETQQGNVRCKLDKVDRHGGTVNWSMTCMPPKGGPIPSSGTAHYTGNTMEATLTAHVPGPNGQPRDTPGRITGRYLGPCDSK